MSVPFETNFLSGFVDENRRLARRSAGLNIGHGSTPEDQWRTAPNCHGSGDTAPEQRARPIEPQLLSG